MFDWTDYARQILATMDERVERRLQRAGINDRTLDAGAIRGELDSSVAFPDQVANTLLAGPTSGGAAAPSFRALVVADIPAHASTHASGGSDPVTPAAIGAATASHNHAAADITSGQLSPARGGTGVDNTGTLTWSAATTITGGGTLALGGFTLTAPATGTAALLNSGSTQTFTDNQQISKANPQIVLNGNSGDTLIRLAFAVGGTSKAFYTLSDGGNTFDIGTAAAATGMTLRLITLGTVRAQIDASGNSVFGSGLGTSSTDGFIYISSCAGAPTGTPTSYASRVPLVYDRTNNKFYVYNSGWKSVTLA